MRFSIAALAVCAGAAQAFKDTSPFLLFSSSPLPKELSEVSTAQLQSSSSVLDTARSFLKNCPSELYYIISQPSLSSSDLLLSDSIPHLKRALKNPGVHSRYSVAEVVGLEDANVEDLVKEIDSQCGGVLGFDDVGSGAWKGALKKGEKVVVITSMDELPAGEDERRELLADNDGKLNTPLTDLAKGYKYTVIYLSTPPSSSIQPSTSFSSSSDVLPYEAEFQHLEHLDLKRALKKVREDPQPGNSTEDQSPLFEKYQFLTPGIFMGLVTGFILIAILSVGFSALGSLQVSYGAFDKEMGPAAQKKQ